MSELKFSGTATLTGFPRDRSFNFELDGPDRLIIKAGKEIFLIIEKEAAPVVVPDLVKAAESHIVVNPPAAGPSGDTLYIQGQVIPLSGAPTPPAEQVVGAQEESSGRKPRGPNVKIDESLLIYLDVNKPNPYGKLRGKYYETLKTAVGRPVSWWKDTQMVKNLEGSPITLLKFFLGENAVELRPENIQTVPPLAQGMQQPTHQVLQGPSALASSFGQPIVPSFGGPVQGPGTPNTPPPASFM